VLAFASSVLLSLAAEPQPEAKTLAPRVSTVEMLAPAETESTGPRRPTSRSVRHSVRRFRRGGFAPLGVALFGLTGAVGVQIARGAWLNRCAQNGDRDSLVCFGWEASDQQMRNWSIAGLAMMFAGSAGAGGMFGNAHATRHAYRGKPKDPSFAKLTGIVTVGVTAAWLVERNIISWQRELRCEEDLFCVARARRQRWLYNDLGALSMSIGAGLLGYALTYARQSKALMKIWAAPTVSKNQAGLSLSASF